MSETFDDLPTDDPMQRVWAGVIATTPTDISQRISVTIPGLDASLRWEKCRWQARNDIDMPNRGEKCLVMFDDNMEAWVVAWWPF